MTAALVLGAVALVFGLLLTAVRLALAGKERETADAVVQAIEAELPQSQCAQCGYPGCRPYAEAVAAGERLDLCLPGGPETATKLKTLLGRGAEAVRMAEPKALVRASWKRIASVALCASTFARWMPSPARPNTCMPSSPITAPVANCACQLVRWIA